jgi:mannose-6-phosphate isomerase-like protein (cupin superfamily)
MSGYTHITERTRVPGPGDKIIEEIVGRVNTKTSDVSIAHMIAPPHWGEPAQTPSFAEITIMLRGKMRVDVDGEVVEVRAGEAIRTDPGVRVRYSNPFDEESEYWAVCLPAFSIDSVRRES